MNDNYLRMIDMLKNQQDLLLVGHMEPDPDCLGSLFALYYAFNGEQKNWQVVTMDYPSANLDYLPGREILRLPHQIDHRPKYVLYVDCCVIKRVGEWLTEYLVDVPQSCIDHHMGGGSFAGDIVLIESDAAATGEIVGALVQEAGVPIDQRIATNIYSALSGDTGCFRFPNTTVRCLAQASVLRPLVDIEQVRIRLYENRSYANMQLLSACLKNMQYAADGLLCYSYLAKEDFRQAAATNEDSHDIVNFTLCTVGVKIGIIFEEYTDYIKVSFRCRSGYRVNELARIFGGGGHVLAAGCRLSGSLADNLPKVIDAAKQMLVNKINN